MTLRGAGWELGRADPEAVLRFTQCLGTAGSLPAVSFQSIGPCEARITAPGRQVLAIRDD